MVRTDEGGPLLEIRINHAAAGQRKGDRKMKLFDKIRSTALARDTRGLSTVEYVIILCLIAAVAVGTWKIFGGMVEERLGSSSGEISGELNSVNF